MLFGALTRHTASNIRCETETLDRPAPSTPSPWPLWAPERPGIALLSPAALSSLGGEYRQSSFCAVIIRSLH